MPIVGTREIGAGRVEWRARRGDTVVMTGMVGDMGSMVTGESGAEWKVSTFLQNAVLYS